jgi:sugar lactone lactonase YvrE
MSEQVELVLDAKATLGEGAIWHAPGQVLYWVDILAGQVHIFDPASGADRAVEVGQAVGTVVPRKAGGVMVALKHGFGSLDLDSGELRLWADPEADKPANRFNDGKCDPAGRFWAGTMQEGVPKQGALYVLEADGRVWRALSEVSTSNGLVWSHDHQTMYYIDTRTREVAAFDYDLATGAIANRRAAVTIPPTDGFPDGMTMDAEGMLWVAHWDGGRVTRHNPADGRLLQTLTLPVSRVTSCAFGGPRLDELYITSARTGLADAELAPQPLAGGLFRARPGAVGVPAYEFAG